MLFGTQTKLATEEIKIHSNIWALLYSSSTNEHIHTGFLNDSLAFLTTSFLCICILLRTPFRMKHICLLCCLCELPITLIENQIENGLGIQKGVVRTM